MLPGVNIRKQFVNVVRPRVPTPLAQAILDEYAEALHTAKAGDGPIPELPEDLITPYLYNTWHDAAEAIVNNWIGRSTSSPTTTAGDRSWRAWIPRTRWA